jgi:hypothetical protein
LRGLAQFLTENPYQRTELGPRFGPTLCNFCSKGAAHPARQCVLGLLVRTAAGGARGPATMRLEISAPENSKRIIASLRSRPIVAPECEPPSLPGRLVCGGQAVPRSDNRRDPRSGCSGWTTRRPAFSSRSGTVSWVVDARHSGSFLGDAPYAWTGHTPPFYPDPRPEIASGGGGIWPAELSARIQGSFPLSYSILSYSTIQPSIQY